MKKITLLFYFIFSTFCFSQTSIEGYIYDKKINESLPYATIKLISSNSNYTITNEDGKFEINSKLPTDSLEVRFFGFQTKKVPITYFEKQKKLHLTPLVSNLKEVVVIADKNYTYNLLYKLIQKYRKEKVVTKSKTFLSLNSSARGIPIEHIEGFYNCNQNLSKGIKELTLKSGRFGQNKSFPFYSIHNTAIITNFQFFEKSNQILPYYPGNMNLSSIKENYTLKIENCNNCSYNDFLISFKPKKVNGRLFLGKILFDSEKLLIKKIELSINDPITKELSSIISNDVIKPKEINLSILFNPIDFSKIQYIDFKFGFYYSSKDTFEIINSNSFFYFYDYNYEFTAPYFTNSIQFNNDYDKILALQASDEFWNTNYQFPKSFNKKKSLQFLEKYGYLVNFTNNIPTDYYKYIKPSIIYWSTYNQLSWEVIKENTHQDPKEIDRNQYKQEATKAIDKEAHSISEFNPNKTYKNPDEQFNFSYTLDLNTNELGKNSFNTRTLFDRNSSFCKYDRINNKLVYIGLIFDVYEVYNRELKAQLYNAISFEEAKILCDKKFNEASLLVEKISLETNFGLNFQNLVPWKLKIEEILKN